MKVAIVTDSYHPTRDGVVACIDIMEGVLNSNGVETQIIAPDPGKGEEHRDGVIYFKSVSFRSYPGYFVPIYPSHTKRIMKQVKPDIVHIQGVALMALKGVISAHRLGIPVIMTFHTMVGDTMKYYSPIKMSQKTGEKLVWKYLRYMTKWVDAIVAPSQATADELVEKGIKVKDIRVIPTPVDRERFSPDVDGTPMRERYGLQDKRVIVCVGRVSFEKNVDILIRALKLLDDDVCLLVVGKGPAMDSLRELADELGLSDRVTLTGFVPDEELVMHYAAADVAAVASRFETQCLCALESMSCGIPTVCAKARAFEDYIRDGENGFLFEDSVEDCADRLRKALDADDELRQKAMETASEFSVPMFLSRMIELYNDCLKKE